MRIAVPCEDARGLDSNVSMHFGRAKFFVIADVANGRIVNVEVVQLPFDEHVPGQIPRFLQSLGVDTILAYGVGMRARMFFESMGIRVITGAYGRVRDVLESFLRGTLVLDVDWEKKEGFGKHHGHCDHHML